MKKNTTLWLLTVLLTGTLALSGCNKVGSDDDDDDDAIGSSRQLSRIEVLPPTATKGEGATQQFAASAIYDNGDIESLNSGVAWTSSAPAVASINANGLASALSP